MAGFNETGADGQIQVQGARVVELVETMAEVTVGGPHGSLLLGDVSRLLAGVEGGQHLRARSPPQSALLGVAPVLGGAGTTVSGGSGPALACIGKRQEPMA